MFFGLKTDVSRTFFLHRVFGSSLLYDVAIILESMLEHSYLMLGRELTLDIPKAASHTW